MQALSPARDWDVFTTTTLARLERACASEVNFDGLRRAAQPHRSASYALLRAALTDPRYTRFQLSLRRWTERRGWGTEVASEALGTLTEPASELAVRPDISVLLMGGRVRGRSMSLVGQLGDAVLGRVNVQTAFLGAAGFTLEEGLTETTEEEALIKRAMVAAVREVYAIVDSSKWGRVAQATFCRLEAIRGVVTDAGAPGGMVAELEGTGVAAAAAHFPGLRFGRLVQGAARRGWTFLA